MHPTSTYRVEHGKGFDLNDFDPADDAGLDHEQADKVLAENAERIRDLQHLLFAEHERSLLVVLQAMDAAGKDSTVRHVFGLTNPQGVRVTSFTRPTLIELDHDCLWRVHAETPRRGRIGLFNRSHYEDVLVVRVDGLVPASRWRARYEAINAFEANLVSEGTTIVKIFLHISRERQKEKLVRRLRDPKRAWKFESQDFVARGKWDEYMHAYQEAIRRCASEHAPWYVVPTDKKWARLALVSQIVRETLERMDPKLPKPRIEPADALALIEQIE